MVLTIVANKWLNYFLLLLHFYLIFFFCSTYCADCFSFSFSNILSQFFYKKNLIKTKYFFVKKNCFLWVWFLASSSMRLATSLRGLCNRYAIAWQLITQLLNIFIAINHTPFHLWWKKKSVKYLKVSKYCDHRSRFRNCTHRPLFFCCCCCCFKSKIHRFN